MKNRINSKGKNNMPKNSRHKIWMLMYAVMAVFFVGISIVPVSARAEKNASDVAAGQKDYRGAEGAGEADKREHLSGKCNYGQPG